MRPVNLLASGVCLTVAFLFVIFARILQHAHHAVIRRIQQGENAQHLASPAVLHAFAISGGVLGIILIVAALFFFVIATRSPLVVGLAALVCIVILALALFLYNG
jgi:hypothetical protein